MPKLSRDEIVNLCHHPDTPLLSHPSSFVKVVHIRDTDGPELAVKFSSCTQKSESKSQKLAKTILNPEIAYVPEVFDFFVQDRIGYLVMEYVGGKAHYNLNDGRRKRLEAAIDHMHSKTSEEHFNGLVGPLGGGEVDDDNVLIRKPDIPESFDFTTKQGVEKYFRTWSGDSSGPGLLKFKFVLVHLDLAHRNLLWRSDGSLCLLDWVTAGIFPALFERCALDLSGNQERNHDPEFVPTLMNHINLTPTENAAAEMVYNAYNYGVKFRNPPLRKN